MSRPVIVLPATGGGVLLLGLAYRRYFLAISAALLGLVLWEALKTLRGIRSLKY